MLQMGDEGHNRNRAGSLMLLRELLPTMITADAPSTTSPRRCASRAPTSTSSSTSVCRLQAFHPGRPWHPGVVGRHDDGAQRHRLRDPRLRHRATSGSPAGQHPRGAVPRVLRSRRRQPRHRRLRHHRDRGHRRLRHGRCSGHRALRRRRRAFALRATQTMYEITVGEHTGLPGADPRVPRDADRDRRRGGRAQGSCRRSTPVWPGRSPHRQVGAGLVTPGQVLTGLSRGTLARATASPVA